MDLDLFDSMTVGAKLEKHFCLADSTRQEKDLALALLTAPYWSHPLDWPTIEFNKQLNLTSQTDFGPDVMRLEVNPSWQTMSVELLGAITRLTVLCNEKPVLPVLRWSAAQTAELPDQCSFHQQEDKILVVSLYYRFLSNLTKPPISLELYSLEDFRFESASH